MITVKGTYQNGSITLNREPDIKGKADVTVIFLNNEQSSKGYTYEELGLDKIL